MKIVSVCGCYQITAMITGNEIGNNHLSCDIEDVVIGINHHLTFHITEEASNHGVVVKIKIPEGMIGWVVNRTNFSETLVALVNCVDRLPTGQNCFSFYIIICRFHPPSLLRLWSNVNYVLPERLELSTTGV